MTIDPELLLSEPALQAAVGALAARNMGHFEQMDDEERQQALGHWRALAVDVLTAARTVLGSGDQLAAPQGPGRAVIVLEDAGGEEVNVHVAFHPELEELESGEIAGTPAQVTAMLLLENLQGGGEQPEEE